MFPCRLNYTRNECSSLSALLAVRGVVVGQSLTCDYLAPTCTFRLVAPYEVNRLSAVKVATDCSQEGGKGRPSLVEGLSGGMWR